MSTIFSRLTAAAWALNVVLLVGVAGWVYLDGRAPHGLDMEWSAWKSDGVQVEAAGVLFAAAAAATAFVMLLQLFFGPRWSRTTRAWLLFTGVVCGWLSLALLWSDLYWAGQQRRVATGLNAATRFADQLAANWPDNDGELPGFGAFLAYPKGEPTVILLLGTAEIPGTNLRFCAVERGHSGVLRFELAGPETDAWLEWRPSGTPPDSFRGGLETDYRVLRYAPLSDRWVLVRYDAFGAGG